MGQRDDASREAEEGKFWDDAAKGLDERRSVKGATRRGMKRNDHRVNLRVD